MAKGPTTSFSGQARDFTEQSTGQAKQAANYGMDWMRQLTEHGLDQSRVVLEGFLSAARSSVDTIDQHATEVRDRSLAMAAETITNSFDFAHQVLRVRDPQQALALQSEFLSRQAQLLAEQAKELGQTVAHGANEMGRTTLSHMQATAESVKRKAEA